MSDVPTPTDREDVKIIALARSARARIAGGQGACVRDTDGRTYAATSVNLPHLRLSAVQVAVAMAVSSGAPGIEAAAVAGDEPDPEDASLLADLPGAHVVLWVCDVQGSVLRTVDVTGAGG